MAGATSRGMGWWWWDSTNKDVKRPQGGKGSCGMLYVRYTGVL